ncbi:putative nuclease HARBI1, partial [Stegodyphus mimosarum]
MTPFSNPSLPREYVYNEKHRKARGAVERCFGVIKSRFRALHDTGGTLLYSPNKVCKMVVAAAVLHNICLKYGVENPEIDVFEDEDPEPSESANSSSVAIALRDELALNFEGGRY